MVKKNTKRYHMRKGYGHCIEPYGKLYSDPYYFTAMLNRVPGAFMLKKKS